MKAMKYEVGDRVVLTKEGYDEFYFWEEDLLPEPHEEFVIFGADDSYLVGHPDSTYENQWYLNKEQVEGYEE